jgi:hypothetical protein
VVVVLVAWFLWTRWLIVLESKETLVQSYNGMASSFSFLSKRQMASSRTRVACCTRCVQGREWCESVVGQVDAKVKDK